MKFLLLATMAIMFCGSALAQAPPVKMGLWEKTMTSSDGKGAPSTVKSRSCITPDEWKAMEANVTRKREGCTAAAVRNAKGYTFDSTCTIGTTTLVIKGSTTIQDAEHIVTESHSTSTRNGQKSQTDTRSTSHFLSADCGKIEPGDSEVEN